MRSRAALLVLLSMLLAAPSATSFTARVVRVIDGDSLDVSRGDGSRGKIEVRLFGIDSPERDQPYADRARAELARLVKGKTVRLEVRDHDSYGRTVARVFAGEARFYLTRCGLTRLDGDGDGVPCEALCRGLSP